MSNEEDLPHLFETFDKDAKRSEKAKWWKNLNASVSSQNTETMRVNNDGLNGMIDTFNEISRVKKPQSHTNKNRSIKLFQCLFAIDISNIKCKKKNGIAKLIKSIKNAAETFKQNEECMEILTQWMKETKETNQQNILPLLGTLGYILIENALNDDFPFKLQRISILNCEDLLNSTTLNDLKYYLESNKIKQIGHKITECGDWYMQYILFKWMCAYYMNCKLCLQEQKKNSNKTNSNYFKKIKIQFYRGLFLGVHNNNKTNKIHSLSEIKKNIKDKINNKLFDLTETKFNGTYHILKGIISNILFDFNDQIFPANSVWTLKNIKQAWIHLNDTNNNNNKDKNKDNDIHFYGPNFKVHIGIMLIYIEYDEMESENKNHNKNKNNMDKNETVFSASIMWGAITKFESDENTMQCCIYFMDFNTRNNYTFYEGTYDNISYIKFQFDNNDTFILFVQDITNNLHKHATVHSVSQSNHNTNEQNKNSNSKKKKKKISNTKTYASKRIRTRTNKKENENKIDVTDKDIKTPKRKRRPRRKSNRNKSNVTEMDEEKQDTMEASHIISSDERDNHKTTATERLKSCDIDLSMDDPTFGAYIKYKMNGNDKWQYGQITYKKGSELEVEVMDDMNGRMDKKIVMDRNKVQCDIISKEEMDTIIMNIKMKNKPIIISNTAATPITETESMKMAVKELSLPVSDKNKKKKDIMIMNVDTCNHDKEVIHEVIHAQHPNEENSDGNDKNDKNEVGENNDKMDVDENNENNHELATVENNINDHKHNQLQNDTENNEINNAINNEMDDHEMDNEHNMNGKTNDDKQEMEIDKNEKENEMDDKKENEMDDEEIPETDEEINKNVQSIENIENINHIIHANQNDTNDRNDIINENEQTDNHVVHMVENNVVHIVEHNNNNNNNINEENMNGIIDKNEENENNMNLNENQDEPFTNTIPETIIREASQKQINENNKNKQTKSIIIVPDSDGSQQKHDNNNHNHNQNNNNDINEDENDDFNFTGRPLQPLQHPQIRSAQKQHHNPYKTPHKSRPKIRSTKRSKRQTTHKWRKRQPLILQNTRHKNKKTMNESNNNNNNRRKLQLQKQRVIERINDMDNATNVTTPATSYNNNNNRNILRQPLQDIHVDNRQSIAKNKRKTYNDRDNYNEYNNENIINIPIPPPKKKPKIHRQSIIMKEKQTQTEGAKPIDIKQIENEISSKFKILFESLFRDKLEELKSENDAFRTFLREKVCETNEIQSEYNNKMKQVQSDIFNKFRKDILKKWKDDVMDICEQLDEHSANIQIQSDDYYSMNNQPLQTNNNNNNNQQRNHNSNNNNNASDDIVRQISSLLNKSYNQN